jgi:hypothetical protein
MRSLIQAVYRFRDATLVAEKKDDFGTEVERPSRIQHTWVSPNTLGYESMVTVTFKKQGEGTLMTLIHSDLPDDDKARSHEKGWNYCLNIFPEQFGDASRQKK